MQAATSGVRDGLGEVKDVDEGKREVLVTIPWEVLDTYRTDFSADCFDEFRGQRSPIMCWQHDKKEPIGVVKDWQKGTRAHEMVAGFSDFAAVPRAHQAFAQIRDGDLKDFSFYYDQAKAIPHPSERSAVRFTKARMPEISPVTVGSIPGAMATGVRADASARGIAELVNAKVITAEEGRAMLVASGDILDIGEGVPQERSAVTVTGDTADALKAAVDARLAELGITAAAITESGQRDDATVTDEVGDLAGAVDAALDQAADLLDGTDLTGLPDNVQQALALVEAAGVASDALLDTMGVADPDASQTDDGSRSTEDDPAPVEPLEGERAAVSDTLDDTQQTDADADAATTDAGERSADDLAVEAEAGLALLSQRFAV